MRKKFHPVSVGAALVLSFLLNGPQRAVGQAGSEVSVSNICHPTILADTVLDTWQDRLVAGEKALPAGIVGPTGFDWSDTEIGAVKSRDGDGYLFFGSDGSCHANCGLSTERDGSITRTAGSLDNPLGDGPPMESLLPQSLQLKANSVIYLGGGPLIRVPAGHPGAGNLLLVYTAARVTNLAQQDGMYDFTGLAKSTDEGLTWTDLGFIITANLPFKPGAPPNYNEYDGGEGNLVADPTGRYYYIYFGDNVAKGGVNNSQYTVISVARVAMDALLHAAFDTDVPAPLPSFQKYFRGKWDQPGLGGLSSSLFNGLSVAGDPEVAWSDYLKRYVLITDNTATITYAESADGINWSPSIALTTSKIAAQLYAFPVGLGDDAAVLGREFYIYYTYYPNPGPTGGGWEKATIKRLDMQCGPM